MLLFLFINTITMKRFKKYLIEVNQPDYLDPEFQRLNDQLSARLENHYNIMPMRPKKPEFSVNRDDGSRTYTWGSWHHAVGSLAHSIAAHHLAEGTFTGKKGKHIISPEQSELIAQQIVSKHQPAIDQLKSGHRNFVKSIAETDSEVGSILDRLKPYNIPMGDIADMHFHDFLNRHLVQAQGALGQKLIGASDSHIHGRVQEMAISLHNRQVSRHQHPLGLFLNGGSNSYPAVDKFGAFGPLKIVHTNPQGATQDITSQFHAS